MVLAMLALAQTLYTDHGNPTPDEQRVLWLTNRARSDPFAEGARLNILPDIREGLHPDDVDRVFAQPPLAMNAKLRQAARDYAQFMWDNNYFWHYFPDNTMPPNSTSTPDGRMTAAGYSNLSNWAENLAMGSNHTAEQLQNLLMIDAGIQYRGHRTNLLDIYFVNPGPPPGFDPGPRREVGIGYLDAGSSKSDALRYILVQNFAESSANSPFLVGTVYLDANNNNEYDLSEGLGGVDLSVTGGSFHALTSSAGGYAFPCPAAGTRDVTASGTSLPAGVVVSRAFSSANLLVDVRVAPQPDGDGDGLPDFWETRFGGSLAPAFDSDGDTFSNLQEFRGGSDPLVQGSTPAPPPAPAPTPPADDDSSDDGGCGATGLDGLAAAILASRLFRGRRRV